MDLWEHLEGYFEEQGDLREIIIQGHETIYFIHAKQKIAKSLDLFSTKEMAIDNVQDFILALGQRFDPLFPANGGILRDSRGRTYRWHALMEPLVAEGVILSIRKQQKWSLNDFLDPDNILAKIHQHLLKGQPLIIYGLTGSGKTSLLHTLMCEHFQTDRVAILENLLEMPATYPGWVRLHTPSARYDGTATLGLHDLFAQALRLLPDRIVVSELRTDEAKIFLDCVLAGYSSTFATLHCNHPSHIKSRLQRLLGKQELCELIDSCQLAACHIIGGVSPALQSFDFIS